MLDLLLQKGNQVLSNGLGPVNWSVWLAGTEYTFPLEESAMIRSREMVNLTRSLPVRVGVGSVVMVEYPVPHCSKSPFSEIAAPKSRSNLMSLMSFPSKYGIRRGALMQISSESGA